MNSVKTDILIIGGGPAGLAAAAAAVSVSDLKIAIVDDNPRLGGQIWRAELGKTGSAAALGLIDAIDTGNVEIINNTEIFDAPCGNCIAAENHGKRVEFEYGKLILATGARERFLPFPGWTLPNVFGAGGLQALVKGGLPIKGKKVVVAGTGPLLLAVAEYLRSKGGNIVAIAEQTAQRNLNRFAVGLWRSPSKAAQGLRLRSKLAGVPYLTDCWVTQAEGDQAIRTVTLARHGRTWSVDCDMLACGFHLVPSIELASLLGCQIECGSVAVDEFQRTSCENIFCAGESTGIGGIEKSLIEGSIAGFSAADRLDEASRLFGKREKTLRFADELNRTFELREELRNLADSETIVCRCEDVAYGRLKDFNSRRSAKLQTRCGMGACQGRVCGAATEFLFGWKTDRIRPPIFPVRMENL